MPRADKQIKNIGQRLNKVLRKPTRVKNDRVKILFFSYEREYFS